MIGNVRLLVFIVFFSACDQSSMLTGSSDKNKSNVRITIDDYKTARPLVWHSVYPNGGKSLYCSANFDSQYREGFNVEHVFPMSWVTNGLKCGKRKQCRARSLIFNRIEADLHNLYPTRSDVNYDRSSFRFGEIPGERRAYGESCDFEVDPRKRVAEPAPQKRGDVARAMFYMAYTYKDQGLVLFNKQAKLLETWHKSDPPDAEERRRNDLIEQLQGNRNRFIDSPAALHQLMDQGYFAN